MCGFQLSTFNIFLNGNGLSGSGFRVCFRWPNNIALAVTRAGGWVFNKMRDEES